MSDEEELNTQPTRMMEIWHEYGQTFNAFVPEGQPFPQEWEPDVPGPDDKGQLRPPALKHWRDLTGNQPRSVMMRYPHSDG